MSAVTLARHPCDGDGPGQADQHEQYNRCARTYQATPAFRPTPSAMLEQGAQG